MGNQNQTALVIGAGIGGIATAIRLAQNGYQVTVIEKNQSAGGRCNIIEKDGHRFDTGPTLFLMPELYKQAFADLGERIEDHLDLIRIDPTYQIHFDDDTVLHLTSDLKAMQDQLEGIETGSSFKPMSSLPTPTCPTSIAISCPMTAAPPDWLERNLAARPWS
ncbi:MAG: FAD-dependent oxidoreductase, partial [Chloroflexi bacterium]|nr:FAD-dependent oxidoreductase [Chloroflexota bacterium]